MANQLLHAKQKSLPFAKKQVSQSCSAQALGKAFGEGDKAIKEKTKALGDLGDVANQLHAKQKSLPFAKKARTPLTIHHVYRSVWPFCWCFHLCKAQYRTLRLLAVSCTVCRVLCGMHSLAMAGGMHSLAMAGL